MTIKILNENGATTSVQCVRCQSTIAEFQVRSENLCSGCFTSYLTQKVLRRLDPNRTQSTTATKRILLPISFGPSSTALLRILDRQLEGQFARSKRVAYELIVIHIDESNYDEQHVCAADNESLPWQAVKTMFPRHEFHLWKLSKALETLSFAETSTLFADTQHDEAVNGLRTVPDYLDMLPSNSSRSDFILTLYRRLIARAARDFSCASIYLGHTSTRLAELVLSETAKGRGAALPLLVGESSELEGIKCFYPARDLMRGEIDVWLSKTEPQLGEICRQQREIDEKMLDLPASSKNATIDQLMTQYFHGVEANYPSIVSNVVRTSARLQLSEDVSAGTHCSFCRLPLKDGRFGLNGWGGDQLAKESVAANAATGDSESVLSTSNSPAQVLCYGCARTLVGAKKPSPSS